MPTSRSFTQFQQSILRGRIDPVYLLEGEEPFLHDEAIRALERLALPEGSSGLDREMVRGDEVSLAEVIDLASTYPMGGERRLVVVRGAEGLRSESADALKDYLARPNPKACLVFSGARFDHRRLVYRALLQGAVRVACQPLDEARTAVWIRQRLQGRGFGITPELTEAIAAGLAGAGLGRLDAELEKLMSSLSPPRPIEATDLALLANVPRVADAFHLARQTIRAARGPAIASLRALLESGEDPLMMLGGMSWYFRNALKARAAGDRRLPPRDMIAQYGLDPGRVDRFRKEIGSATTGDLREALRLCLQSDREIKGMGARDPAHALERLIHRIGRRVRRSA